MIFFQTIASAFFVISIAACSSGESPADGQLGGMPGTSSGSSSGGGSVLSAGDGGTSQSAPSGPQFYAHDLGTIYAIDPSSKFAVRKIGIPECLGQDQLTDIAVTKDGRVFAVGFHFKSIFVAPGQPEQDSDKAFVYDLDVSGKNVKCKHKWPVATTTINGRSASFNALTFAPEGTLDPAKEVLIGGTISGDVYTVDTSTGAYQTVGKLGAAPGGQSWGFSGDMVFAANGGKPVAFATVRSCAGVLDENCSKVDSLVELDVTKIGLATSVVTKFVRGAMVSNNCATGASGRTFGSVLGLALLKDKAYGFQRDDTFGGRIVEVSLDNANTCVLSEHPGIFFNGAGVTTVVPVVAPTPPK